MAISEKFKNRINELVSEQKDLRGIGRVEIANEIPVDYNSLANALNYGILPTTRILMKMADYFCVPLDFLLGRTDAEDFVKSEKGETFAVRIAALCDGRRVKFAKVSKECHLDRGYIRRWIKTGYLPELEFLDILAAYFGVSLDYLLGRSDEEGKFAEDPEK